MGRFRRGVRRVFPPRRLLSKPAESCSLGPAVVAEANPMDHLWRAPKQKVAANCQDATIERVVARVLRYVRRLTPRAALRKAGVLSPGFWLRAALSK